MFPRFLGFLIVNLLLALLVIYNTAFIVTQTETALITQFGDPVRIEYTPGLKFKLPFLQTVEYFDKRLLEYTMPDEVEINTSDEKRIRLEAFLRWRIVDPLAFARATRQAGIGGSRVSTMNMQLDNILGSSLRQVIGNVPLSALLSPDRDRVMHEIQMLVEREASLTDTPDTVDPAVKPKDTHAHSHGFGISIVDVRIVKADLPPENSAAIFQRMQTEREREAKRYRAQGDEEAQGIKAHADRERTELLATAQNKAETLRGEGDAEAIRISADAYNKDPDFYGFYRSLQAYERAFTAKDTTLVLSPDSAFMNVFSHPDTK